MYLTIMPFVLATSHCGFISSLALAASIGQFGWVATEFTVHGTQLIVHLVKPRRSTRTDHQRSESWRGWLSSISN